MAFKGDGSRNRGTGRADSAPGGRNNAGGGRGGGDKKAGNATVADHMIATGEISVPSIGPNGVAQGNYASQDDAYNDFSKAVGDYETRSTFGKIADFLGGSWFDQQAPISQNPRTFAKGTYHTSTNPAGVVAGIAGGMINPAFGQVTGPLGAMAYNAAGGLNISHGGYSQPDTGIYDDPSGGWGAAQTASGGGLMGGGPPSQHENRGYQGNNGLLGGSNPAPATQGLLQEAAKTPQALQERAARQWGFGSQGIPGPSPYNFTTARWL